MKPDELRQWIGWRVTDRDILSPRLARQYNATFDLDGGSNAGDEALTDAQARGRLTLADGRDLCVHYDLDASFPEEVLAAKLRAKTEATLGAAGLEIGDRLDGLDGRRARHLGATITV